MKILKKIIKKIKIRNLIVLIILLSFNTYAWFVYNSTISTGITAHILAWDIFFTTEGAQTAYMNFNVSEIYPGMTTYSESLQITNRGEVAATIIYEIESVQILGTTYELGGEITSETLENKLLNDYPFVTTVSIDLLEIGTSENSTSEVTVELEWPFESGNDELDSYWGNQAYVFLQSHPTDPCISVTIKFTATQAAEE